MAEVTIVVPVYNVEKFLRRCIDSILNQTFQDFQLVLVNDGSTDQSGQICDEYEKVSDKITVIHKENGGLSSARNAGIEVAQTPYIGFVDSDDFIEAKMYQVLHEALKVHNADIASVDYLEVAENQSIPEKVNADHISYDVYKEKETVHQLFKNHKIHRCAWNKLYKLELFKEVRYPHGKIFEDTFTTYKLYALANKVVATDYKGYFYMQNDASITRRDFTPKNFDLLSETQRILDDMATNYPELIQYEQARLAEHYVGLVMRILNSKPNPENKRHMDVVVKKIKQDYQVLRHNQYVDKKIRNGLIFSNYVPNLFFFVYKVVKGLK